MCVICASYNDGICCKICATNVKQMLCMCLLHAHRVNCG